MTEQEHTEKKNTEEFVVDGEKLLSKVKELISEGNVTRIIIKSKEDKVLVEFPVTIGVVGAIIAPMLVAVGAIAALVTECKVVVVRRQD